MFIVASVNKFPCSATTSVSELQFCDGTADCQNGSDEPPSCLAGILVYVICKVWIGTIFQLSAQAEHCSGHPCIEHEFNYTNIIDV